MFNIFNKPPVIKRINYCEIQHAIKNKCKPILASSYSENTAIIINTLPINCQQCVIATTVQTTHEEQLINEILLNMSDQPIIIYGRNSTDESVYTKLNQLTQLGLSDIKIYTGGLFEWLLLKDVYGNIDFPTEGVVTDLLNYS
jgi:hypothetical protein